MAARRVSVRPHHFHRFVAAPGCLALRDGAPIILLALCILITSSCPSAPLRAVGVLAAEVVLETPTPETAGLPASKHAQVNALTESLRQRVREMFQHGFDNYLVHGYPYDELQPLSCSGKDTWGPFKLTLLDSIDTLYVLGNYAAFEESALALVETLDFHIDRNVSVFETNIRVVGGLLSAHHFSRRLKKESTLMAWYQAQFLDLAVDVADRLLPAFDTPTGIPYGTVNLIYGVPSAETPITSLAAAGTNLIEFITLSHMTGDARYANASKRAALALWLMRSSVGRLSPAGGSQTGDTSVFSADVGPQAQTAAMRDQPVLGKLGMNATTRREAHGRPRVAATFSASNGLLGNHIDVKTGLWTIPQAGIGGNQDSYYEYLLKAYILTGDTLYLQMFKSVYDPLLDYAHQGGGIYHDVAISSGSPVHPWMWSLGSFWGGLQVLYGDIKGAIETTTAYEAIWKKYGALPEIYNTKERKPHAGFSAYPLRPELCESMFYLYSATKDVHWIELGAEILDNITQHARVDCGFTTIKDVTTHEKEDRMESFFLAETLKYLFLLFDKDRTKEFDRYIFNTEAHLLPLLPAAGRQSTSEQQPTRCSSCDIFFPECCRRVDVSLTCGRLVEKDLLVAREQAQQRHRIAPVDDDDDEEEEEEDREDEGDREDEDASDTSGPILEGDVKGMSDTMAATAELVHDLQLHLNDLVSIVDDRVADLLIEGKLVCDSPIDSSGGEHADLKSSGQRIAVTASVCERWGTNTVTALTKIFTRFYDRVETASSEAASTAAQQQAQSQRDVHASNEMEGSDTKEKDLHEWTLIEEILHTFVKINLAEKGLASFSKRKTSGESTVPARKNSLEEPSSLGNASRVTPLPPPRTPPYAQRDLMLRHRSILWNNCVDILSADDEYWRYRVCFARSVSQVHLDRGGRVEESISLGTFTAFADVMPMALLHEADSVLLWELASMFSRPEVVLTADPKHIPETVVQEFDGGEECIVRDGESRRLEPAPRRATVVYKCKPAAEGGSVATYSATVDEPVPCVYKITIATPLMCRP